MFTDGTFIGMPAFDAAWRDGALECGLDGETAEVGG
jgi:hypothetical protein